MAINEDSFKGSGRKFLGHIYKDPNDPEDCCMIMCEECHSRFIQGTPLASTFSQILTVETWDTKIPGGFQCLLYSPRLKSKLHEAVKQGDLAAFAQFWNMRVAIGKRRRAWKPILEEQKRKQDAQNQIQGLNNMMAIDAQADALMMRGGASFAEAAMTDTGARYGNSTVTERIANRNRIGIADFDADWHGSFICEWSKCCNGYA